MDRFPYLNKLKYEIWALTVTKKSVYAKNWCDFSSFAVLFFWYYNNITIIRISLSAQIQTGSTNANKYYYQYIVIPKNSSDAHFVIRPEMKTSIRVQSISDMRLEDLKIRLVDSLTIISYHIVH